MNNTFESKLDTFKNEMRSKAINYVLNKSNRFTFSVGLILKDMDHDFKPCLIVNKRLLSTTVKPIGTFGGKQNHRCIKYRAFDLDDGDLGGLFQRDLKNLGDINDLDADLSIVLTDEDKLKLNAFIWDEMLSSSMEINILSLPVGHKYVKEVNFQLLRLADMEVLRRLSNTFTRYIIDKYRNTFNEDISHFYLADIIESIETSVSLLSRTEMQDIVVKHAKIYEDYLELLKYNASKEVLVYTIFEYLGLKADKRLIHAIAEDIEDIYGVVNIETIEQAFLRYKNLLQKII